MTRFMLKEATTTKVGHELHVPVAPVGIAFAEASGKRFKVYQVDHWHPTAVGSYLAACTLVATLFRVNPKGAAGLVEGYPVDVDGNILDNAPGVVHPSASARVTLVNLSSQDAQSLQDIAWRTTLGNHDATFGSEQ